MTATDQLKGYQVAGVHAGLKKDNQLDFALIASDTDCVTAGVFTTNTVKAACVLVDMERLEDNPLGIRAVAINTKTANACTGAQGIENAEETARLVAEKLGCASEQVLVMSTGVIGTHLPMDKIANGIEKAHAALGSDWESTAKAIMTTDTRHKLRSRTVTTHTGKSYSVVGITKGAGMIAPNMATTLGVVVTDALLPLEYAQAALSAVSDQTYNCIVVDGDTSTNDTLLLMANGASGVELETYEEIEQFRGALYDVCRDLAQDIVKDAEGVTKFVTLRVTGAPDDEAARQIANTIAISPLVKTAFFGNDANWGRLMMAAGRSGVPVDAERTTLHVAPGEVYSVTDAAVKLFEGGTVASYSEDAATAIVSEAVFTILLDCGLGAGAASVWTCDLSHDYVTINGDYRT